jgi:hypothetical protein
LVSAARPGKKQASQACTVPVRPGPLSFVWGGSHVRKFRWLFALALVGLMAPAFAQDAATKLGWKFEKGKTFYQEMKTTTEQTMKVMGSDIKQKQEQTFWFSWTPKEQKGDNWEITQKIEGVKMRIEIGGQPIEYDSTKEQPGQPTALSEFFKQLVGSEFTLTVDKNFKVTEIKGRDEFLKKLTGSNPQMETLLKTILSEEALKEMADPTFAAIPNKEVKKNDNWDKTSKLNMGPIGTYENNYKYTFEGKDKDKAKIKVETTLKYTPPEEKTQSGGLPFKITSASLASKNAGGEIIFDAEKGRVDESSMKVDLSGDLSIEIGGQKTAVKLEQTQTTNVKTSDTNFVKK